MRIVTTALAAVLALAACGGDEQASEPDQAEVRDAVEDAIAEELGIPDSLGDCDNLSGIPTTSVVDTGLCDDGDTQQILITAFQECTDGRKLHWNDFGWGYSDGDWQAHDRADGQLVPPDGDMADCRP